MKIILNASRELDRQIAKMCLGDFVMPENCDDEFTLVGFDPQSERWICTGWTDTRYEGVITIALSKVERNLRMAIGTDIFFNTNSHKPSCKLVGMDNCQPNNGVACYVKSVYSGQKRWVQYRELKLSTEWLRESGVEIVGDV